MRNRLVLCTGFRGSGKSTLAANILKPELAVFVFDPHGDPAYSFISNTARSIEQLRDYRRWLTESVKRGQPPKRIALRYLPDGRRDPYEALDEFCAWVWPWRNCWLCIEEVSEGTRSPSAAGMPPELRRIVNQGRHRGINQVYCGLRYSEIPRPISAGADVQILFACREPGDLDAMRSRIGSEATERVQGLARHEALVFFPDRTWRTVGSREPGIAELVLEDSANVSADVQEERA